MVRVNPTDPPSLIDVVVCDNEYVGCGGGSPACIRPPPRPFITIALFMPGRFIFSLRLYVVPLD